MNQVNRIGLFTAAITAVASLGTAHAYYTLDKKISFENHYAALFNSLPNVETEVSTKSAVAGIMDIKKTVTEATNGTQAQITPPPAMPFNYTELYKTELGSPTPGEDTFSKERLTKFIEEHSSPLNSAELTQPLSTSSQSQKEILDSYTKLPSIDGQEILALLSVSTDYQSAAINPVIEKIRTILLSLEGAGTLPAFSSEAEHYAGVLTAINKNLTLVSRVKEDFVGGLIGAEQLKNLAPVLDQSTTDLTKALTIDTSKKDCGFCLKTDELLDYGTVADPKLNSQP